MWLRILLILWIATGSAAVHSLSATSSDFIERALPRLNAARQQAADMALQDTFTLQGVTGSPLQPNNKGYNWDHRGPKDDKEWAWFLNRHRYFEELYLAYCASGDSRYAEKIYCILEDWLKVHKKPPRHMSFSSAWRPLEAARRILESWDIVYLKLWHDPTFPEHLRTAFRDCLEAHGDYLQRHHALYGNHLITEMIALLKVAVLCPSATNSEAWMRYALNKLDEEYSKQVYPEGAHKELSAHYQRVVALNYQQLLALLQAAERTDLLDDWKPRVETLWSYFAGISKPNGTAPLNNDSDRESVDSHLYVNGHANLANPVESKYYPNAGQVVLRSAQPEDEPLWAFFDIGPRGTDHQHEDRLHLSLSYGDFDVLVDHGRYTYKPGRWRDYFQGPRGHNVLMVDGHASQAMPNAAMGPLEGSGYIHNNRIEAAWGENAFRDSFGALQASWQRCVIRLPDDVLLVLDHLVTFRPRTIEGFWHGAPSSNWSIKNQNAQIQKADRVTTLTYAASHNKTLQTTLHTGQAQPTIRGWHSERFNRKTPSCTLRYSTIIDAPTIFAWFFSKTSSPIQIQSLDYKGRRVRIDYQNTNQQAHQLSVQLPLANQPLSATLSPQYLP
jgi:prepilin-type processing-associated H-X9-DG protein